MPGLPGTMAVLSVRKMTSESHPRQWAKGLGRRQGLQLCPADRSSPQRPRGSWDRRWGADAGGEVRRWGPLAGPSRAPGGAGSLEGKDAPIEEEVTLVLRPQTGTTQPCGLLPQPAAQPQPRHLSQPQACEGTRHVSVSTCSHNRGRGRLSSR